MVRSRLACVALALGLGVLGGCTCFARPTRTAAAPADCGCGSGETITEGPVLNGSLPPGFAPSNPGMMLTPPPEQGPPPTRIVPQATPQAQVAPYVPR